MEALLNVDVYIEVRLDQHKEGQMGIWREMHHGHQSNTPSRHINNSQHVLLFDVDTETWLIVLIWYQAIFGTETILVVDQRNLFKNTYHNPKHILIVIAALPLDMSSGYRPSHRVLFHPHSTLTASNSSLSVTAMASSPSSLWIPYPYFRRIQKENLLADNSSDRPFSPPSLPPVSSRPPVEALTS